jgi:NADPH2:quinone reductase
VVYDSVGKDTWPASLDCLRPLGVMVSFGNASGAVPPINASDLASRGSLFFTRPTLFTYTASREDLVAGANDLFDAVRTGKVRIEVRQRYPLAQAAQAHIDLEARRTTGSTVLVP